jgi:sulfoquinovosidase
VWRRVGSESLDQVSSIAAANGGLMIGLPGMSLRVSFHTPEIVHLEVRPSASGGRWWRNAVSLAVADSPDAHYLGFGQRFNRVDQRGQEPYFLVEEGGVGYGGLKPVLKHIFGERGSFPNGEQCTGFPVPFFLTVREGGPTAGFFWDTYRPSWSSVARGGVTRVTVLDRRLDGYVCAGPTPLEAIRQYTTLTGRPNLPPPWIFLPWKTRTGAVVEGDVLEDVRRFRELEIPLAQVGIEHWQDVRGSYEFSRKWFPHVDRLIATARENGYRVHIWHFPYMNAGARTHWQGVRRGYFLMNRLGLPYQQRIFHGTATVVDYSNPSAARWHEEIVAKAFHRRGIQGVMTDYAESIPPDCVFHNGQDGLSVRNAYPVMYCQAMQRSAEGVLGDDYAIYPRAGYAGSQRYVTMQWPGDQDTDWDDGDGLPAAVRAMLNASICGFPVHGSDIGGWYDWFTPITTKELYLRWAEVGTYSPLMRAHGGPIGRNREPWKFDTETVEIYRTLSQEHVRLFPYLYSLAKEAAATGLPVIRHPALIWPQRSELYGVEDAWMIGEALYVAPVVRQGQTQRTVVLPPGEWWSVSDDRPVTGPSLVVADAPFGKVPLFLRRGYPLPRFRSAFDTFDEGTKARVGHLDDPLEVWLYAGPTGRPFTLFDGTVLDGQAGRREARGGPPREVGWRGGGG